MESRNAYLEPNGVERAYDENLNGYRIHGGNLIYGFIKQGNDRIVEMNGNRASMLDLAMLPPSEVRETLIGRAVYLVY